MLDMNNSGEGDADLDKVEERGVTSVTEVEDKGKQIIPAIGFGVVVLIGLAIMWRGVSSQGEEPASMISEQPTVQYSTGVQGGDSVPAFQKTLRGEQAVAQPTPPPVTAMAPPVDRAATRLQMRRANQSMELERREREQAMQIRGERSAFELQRDRKVFQNQVELEKALKQRREAPALIFDDSKEEQE